MKYGIVEFLRVLGLSLSLRRAWIEIFASLDEEEESRRSPYGERGLKSQPRASTGEDAESLSLRRAWIEIYELLRNLATLEGRSPYGERGLKYRSLSKRFRSRSRSLSLRRAWIEILLAEGLAEWFESLSLRRAWIEIRWQVGQGVG